MPTRAATLHQGDKEREPGTQAGEEHESRQAGILRPTTQQRWVGNPVAKNHKTRRTDPRTAVPALLARHVLRTYLRMSGSLYLSRLSIGVQSSGGSSPASLALDILCPRAPFLLLSPHLIPCAGRAFRSRTHALMAEKKDTRARNGTVI